MWSPVQDASTALDRRKHLPVGAVPGYDSAPLRACVQRGRPSAQLGSGHAIRGASASSSATIVPRSGLASDAGPHPGRTVGSAGGTADNAGAPAHEASHAPPGAARPRRTRSSRSRSSRFRAAQPIALRCARRSPATCDSELDTRNRRRRTACRTSGALRHPRKCQRNPKMSSASAADSPLAGKPDAEGGSFATR